MQPTETRLLLNEKGIKRIQFIVGDLLYVVRAVNNKHFVVLSAIESQQAAATEDTTAAIEQLLDYVATYPNDGILFRKSDMILAAHADAGFINESRSRSRSGAHIFLSENEPKPKLNGPVFKIIQIIKTVIASAAEVEMAALTITAKKMIPLRHTLIKMGWTQPQTPIQTDNSISVEFTNKTIVNKATKLEDMKLWWLRDIESQEQFRYIGRQGLKMKEITAQSIILQFIMKQREKIHTWSNFPFLHILST